MCKKLPKASDERILVEQAYQRAQALGVSLNGYTLRFVIEYWLGREKGLWN